MYRKMNLLETTVMVLKNIAGLTAVAGIGIFRKHYVKVICLIAVSSGIYMII